MHEDYAYFDSFIDSVRAITPISVHQIPICEPENPKMNDIQIEVIYASV